MGMSRSVSAVTAFYIKSGKTFAEAGQLIKNARQKVRPNNGKFSSEPVGHYNILNFLRLYKSAHGLGRKMSWLSKNF